MWDLERRYRELREVDGTMWGSEVYVEFEVEQPFAKRESF